MMGSRRLNNQAPFLAAVSMAALLTLCSARVYAQGTATVAPDVAAEAAARQAKELSGEATQLTGEITKLSEILRDRLADKGHFERVRDGREELTDDEKADNTKPEDEIKDLDTTIADLQKKIREKQTLRNAKADEARQVVEREDRRIAAKKQAEKGGGATDGGTPGGNAPGTPVETVQTCQLSTDEIIEYVKMIQFLEKQNADRGAQQVSLQVDLMMLQFDPAVDSVVKQGRVDLLKQRMADNKAIIDNNVLSIDRFKAMLEAHRQLLAKLGVVCGAGVAVPFPDPKPEAPQTPPVQQTSTPPTLPNTTPQQPQTNSPPKAPPKQAKAPPKAQPKRVPDQTATDADAARIGAAIAIGIGGEILGRSTERRMQDREMRSGMDPMPGLEGRGGMTPMR